MDWRNQHTKLHTDNTRSSVPVYGNLQRSWASKPHCDPARNRGNVGHRYYKYILPVICLTNLATAPATLAETVGGVSATASPIANSSGSVTNQAIQVLQGPYITNTYGGGISCQGPTLNITPFVTHSRSYQDPYEGIYYEPQYDGRDVKGQKVEIQQQVKNYPWEEWYDDRTYISDGSDGNEIGSEQRWFPDGADMTIVVEDIQPDGIPDQPGKVLWDKPVRTGQKDNLSTNIGLSATMSFPLDGGLQERCKAAADTQTALMRQTVANKRLDFEIARLKNCGELMKAGIRFHRRSPYYAICADVVVQNVNTIPQHRHSIPSTSLKGAQSAIPSQPGSADAALLGAPLSTVPGSSFPVRSQSSSSLSSQLASPLLTKDQREVLRAVPTKLPQQQ